MFVVLGYKRLSPGRSEMWQAPFELFALTYDLSGVGVIRCGVLETLNPGVPDYVEDGET